MGARCINGAPLKANTGSIFNGFSTASSRPLSRLVTRVGARSPTAVLEQLRNRIYRPGHARPQQKLLCGNGDQRRPTGATQVGRKTSGSGETDDTDHPEKKTPKPTKKEEV